MHGWDLAVATGQQLELPADLLAHLHGTVFAGVEQGRKMGMYGAEVAVPADAPTLDRILFASATDGRVEPGDCPPAKLNRSEPAMRIGDPGPKGRILIRGEYGHDIIDELAPADGELVIDKPGKGSFYATGLDDTLRSRGITSLIVTGVTTEVCVHTTVREANDRGYECLVLSDCVGSYFPEFQRYGLAMIAAQGGIFGWVAPSEQYLKSLS